MKVSQIKSTRSSGTNDVVRARIPSQEKCAFEEIIAEAGLDTSTFIRLAIRQTILRRAVPFAITAGQSTLTPNTRAALSAKINTRFREALTALSK